MNNDSDEPELHRRRRGCVCFPKGDGPGYCPGQHACPLLAQPDPEPNDDPEDNPE
jgi:hypothetical protein